MATTTLTTTMETTMSLTLTVARSPETTRRLVLIARLSDDMGDTINSLQQLQHYGSSFDQLLSTSASASRLAVTLSSIRASLERIRGFMMSDEATISSPFSEKVDICTTTGKTLDQKLGPIAAASAPPPRRQLRLGNVTVVSAGADGESDSDGESMKGGRNGGEKSATGHFSLNIDSQGQNTGTTLRKFQPFADNLLTGLEVLLKASGYTFSLEQEQLLGNLTSHEIFNQIKQDEQDLTVEFGRNKTPPGAASRLRMGLSRLAFGARFLPNPAKATALLKTSAPESHKRQSLSRAHTWPLLKQLEKRSSITARVSPDKEAREARQRSQLIDKQIEADMNQRNKESLILSAGPHSAMTLVIDRLLAKSTRYSSHAPAKIEEAERASEACISTIRKTILSEVREMISAARSSYIYTHDPTETFWTEGELSYLGALGSKANEDNVALQDLVEPLEMLWSWDKFREACKRQVGHTNGRLEAHNVFIMDSLRRVSAPDYVPTQADYHHFYLHHRRSLFRGKFDFDAFSVTWVDIGSLCCCSPLMPRREKSMYLFDPCTAYVKFIDLAIYDLMLLEDETVSDLASELDVFQSIADSRRFRTEMSVIAVFTNVQLFREKLAKRPLSRRLFPEYAGEDGNESQTLEFVLGLFRARCTKRKMYVHVGEPEDPKTTEFILEAIKDTKLNSALSEAGVIKMGRS